MRRPGKAVIWMVFGFVLLITMPVSASTMRHDRAEDDYVNYGDGIRLVGAVRNGLLGTGGFGSGVVIDRQWVLTAAHVVANPDLSYGITFETDPDPADPDPLPLSGLFGVSEVYLHEYYDDSKGPAGGFDIALLKLDAPVNHYTPWSRLRGNPTLNPELGRKSTAVGFGSLGTGLTGYDPATAGFYRIAGDNTLDGLGNDPRVIGEFVSRDVTDPKTGLPVHFSQDQIARQFMLSDFDAPDGVGPYANPLGSATPWNLEACVAPGDSGGPVFVDDGSGLVVAGLNSWILGLPDPDGDGTDDATYGDLAGYLRISEFNGWIDDVIGVPEPGTASLALLAGGFALMRRRARH